jgi:hypothetical protein
MVLPEFHLLLDLSHYVEDLLLVRWVGNYLHSHW